MGKIRQVKALFLAVVLASCGTSQTLSGARSATLDPSAQASVCIAAHHLTASSDSQTSLGAAPIRNITTYRACAWPPASYAASDGYSEIVVTSYVWAEHPEVTGASAPDVARSPCAELELTYNFQKQGPTTTTPPLRLLRGAVVDIFGKPWPPPGSTETLPFAHTAADVVVVHNLSYEVASARCVS